MGPWGFDEARHFAADATALPVEDAVATLEIVLPVGTSRHDFALVARDRLQIGRRAKVTEPQWDEALWGAPVASLGDIGIASNARLGALYALGAQHLVLDAGVSVSGYVKASQQLRKKGPAWIRRGVLEGASRAVEALRWPVPPLKPASPDGELPHAPLAGALRPGAYREVVVAAGTTLTLTSAQYSMARLEVEAGATLGIDNAAGPVLVWVAEALILRGRIALTASKPNVLWGYAGAAPPEIASPFSGVLVAPRAEVHIPATEEKHRSSVFARSIVVEDGAHVEHWVFYQGER